MRIGPAMRKQTPAYHGHGQGYNASYHYISQPQWVLDPYEWTGVAYGGIQRSNVLYGYARQPRNSELYINTFANAHYQQHPH